MNESTPDGYEYHDASGCHTQNYLWQPVVRELLAKPWPGGTKPVFDLGCGNGAFSNYLHQLGFAVSGIDASETGISIANREFPHLRLEQGSAYDDLASRFGRFPIVVSLEVVEHLFYPRQFASCIANLLEPGGTALISTPYHSYWKNLAISILGKWDAHFSPLWDYGHIKFWSFKTLTKLFNESGLQVERFLRVGRIPILAKSMIAVVRKPQSP